MPSLNTYTKDECVQAYYKFQSMHNRAMMAQDAKRPYPSKKAITTLFGSWNAFIRYMNEPVTQVQDKLTGDELCSECGNNSVRWWYVNESRLCGTCYSRYYYTINPEKWLKVRDKRKRNFGFNVINTYFKGAHAHHLHVNNNEDVIYIPAKIHRLAHHSVHNNQSMGEINTHVLLWALNYYKHDKYTLGKIFEAFSL